MHSIAEISSNVPAFLAKLWKMVEDPVTNDLITWSSTGTGFVIKDEIRFARDLLPMYYKHNNMASFIRQLNMYGFHKIVSPDAGTMKLETPDEIKFTHPFFMRGLPKLLENIKRKIGVSKVLTGELGEKTPQVINKVLTDVRQMKGRQENLDSRLTAMKMENEALWRELSVMRQKHTKQQQIVNKLIQFLVMIMQQNHNNFSVKRKFPRMLQHLKSAKHHDEDAMHDHTSNANSPTGPVIHELDPAEALLETVVEEAEAETETQADVSDYFLNPANEVEEVVVVGEDPESVKLYKYNDSDSETIIGVAEDTLIPNILSQQQQKSSRNNNKLASSLSAARKSKKGQQILRPKYVKIISKKPKKTTENKCDALQGQLLSQNIQYQQMERDLLNQIQSNQQQMEINQHQMQRMKQQQQNTQQTNPQKNQQQQAQDNQQEKLLLERLQQQPQQPSEPVITIPFDSGDSMNLITEVDPNTVLDPSYVDTGTENILPMVVEVPQMAASPSQLSPNQVSPEDFLISSPMVVNNPVLTPQCDPVVSPNTVPTAPSPESNAEMQVARVDESQVTSPFISRSAFSSEMDNHIDSVQSDLENLKELLHSEGICLDANTLLGYFNDDPMSYNISDNISGDNADRMKENNGNEMMTYNPSLLDLTDLLGSEWSLPSPKENLPAEEELPSEVNTPQFVPNSPFFPTPAKKRKK